MSVRPLSGFKKEWNYVELSWKSTTYVNSKILFPKTAFQTISKNTKNGIDECPPATWLQKRAELCGIIMEINDLREFQCPLSGNSAGGACFLFLFSVWLNSPESSCIHPNLAEFWRPSCPVLNTTCTAGRMYNTQGRLFRAAFSAAAFDFNLPLSAFRFSTLSPFPYAKFQRTDA
jgi:hypothetical protein